MRVVEPERQFKLSEIEQALLTKHDYPVSRIDETMEKLEEIDRLREEKNAIILAHYYQIPPIQLIADFRGDSLALAQKAQEIHDKDLVVSSTVKFMAEMTKLLAPEKKVVTPALDASCSIAEGVDGSMVRSIRGAFPGSGVISYINTYADTKAQVDSVCTSANANDIVSRLEGDPIILLPDYFFFKNVVASLPKEVKDMKTFLTYKERRGDFYILEDTLRGKEHAVSTRGSRIPLLDKGTCIVHEQFSPGEIDYLRKKDEIDVVMAHPEVAPEVAAKADMVGGTGKMLSYVAKDPSKKYLVITECDLTAPLKETYPDTNFYTPCKLCPYMKKNDLDSLLHSIKNEVYEIHLDPKTAAGARSSLEKMFSLMGGKQ